MRPTRVIANRAVEDIEQARWFYQDYLGLSVESMNQGWVARYETPDGAAVVQLTGGDRTAPVHADLSVPVGDGVEEAYATAQRFDLEIVHPLTTEPWGLRRFFLRAPDGTVVNVASHQDAPPVTDDLAMAPTPARPPQGEVWHFSENPSITSFAPHVARTAQVPDAYVWAVAADRAPDYWFRRQMPRAMAWRTPGTDDEVADRLLGVGVDRVHVIEYPSLAEFTSATIYAYPFAADDFSPIGDPPNAMVATGAVAPLGPPLAITDLVAQHASAGIQLRVVDDLFDWWHQVVATDLGFSGIRLKNSPNHREPS